jgi:hypothetical protein
MMLKIKRFFGKHEFFPLEKVGDYVCPTYRPGVGDALPAGREAPYQPAGKRLASRQGNALPAGWDNPPVASNGTSSESVSGSNRKIYAV